MESWGKRNQAGRQASQAGRQASRRRKRSLTWIESGDAEVKKRATGYMGLETERHLHRRKQRGRETETGRAN
eukprot:767594-Hanusia_phi.AAC.23